MTLKRTINLIVFSLVLVIATTVAWSQGVDVSTPATQSQIAVEPLKQQEQAHHVSIPLVLLTIVVGILLLAPAAFLLIYPDGNKAVRKFVYIFFRSLIVDVGVGGFCWFVLQSCLASFITAFVKSMGSNFDLYLFLTLWGTLTVAGVLTNVLNVDSQVKKLLGPRAGSVWRDQRKTETAAILKRINVLALQTSAPEIPVVRALLTDLLDVIVKHVRDHRGCSKVGVDVFANILIFDGVDTLTVVARNPAAATKEHHRKVPKDYPKSDLFCWRAISQEKVMALSNLFETYKEAPKATPYKSILAIPLFSSDNKETYGALSIDCTFPYFFDSFAQNRTEEEMGNSLLPYSQLIILVLEVLIGKSRTKLARKLRAEDPPTDTQGATK